MEHVIFHHNGREYTIYDALTIDEIKTIMTMEEERNRKLDALNKKSMKKYFEDTDKMTLLTLRLILRFILHNIASDPPKSYQYHNLDAGNLKGVHKLR